MFKIGLNNIDIALSILFAATIIILSFIFQKKITSPQIRRFFIPFILFKLLCAILFVLIHVYYYKGGDTFLYFAGGKFFANEFSQNFVNGVKLTFEDYSNIKGFNYSSNYTIIKFFNAPDVLFMSKIISPLVLLSFNQFMATTILYTFLMSSGIWAIYITFCRLYPSLTKQFAIVMLFYPSLGIWGSGILKDPASICSVGFIFYATYQIIYNRKFLVSIFLIISGLYILLTLKPYILYMIVPVMLFWSYSTLASKLKENTLLKYLIPPIILAIFSLGGYLMVNQISEGAGKYSLEKIESVAKGFHSWHTYLAETRDQSGYDLGDVEFTTTGILKKVPEAIFVTYYRPLPIIDTSNVALIFEGVQSFALLIFTLIIIIKVGVFNFVKILFQNRNVKSFMIFALLFGFAVGFTSYNFGALSRYKIPALPFFTGSLVIIYYLGRLKKDSLGLQKTSNQSKI